jgi:hypothetical protein
MKAERQADETGQRVAVLNLVPLLVRDLDAME